MIALLSRVLDSGERLNNLMTSPLMVISQCSGAMAGIATCKSQERLLPIVVRFSEILNALLEPSFVDMIS